VSLVLHGGQLLGLIGPNGAGKTTLLRAIVGLQPLTHGVVRILGEPLVPEADELRQHIGFTPDTPAVYEDLTVRTYLRAVARGYGLKEVEADERIDFWLEKVWLTEKATSKIKGLSRGMRQRIGIARTLLPNPSLIVLDEPAAGLDPAGRVQFRELLCMLREQGKALIVSSHILADMDEYCTHIAIMGGGRLLRFGTVAEVAEHHVNGRRKYAMTVAGPASQVVAVLTGIDALDEVQVDGDRVTFRYPGEPARAAELLARLVKDGLPVASFTSDAPRLEEAYLKTVTRQGD
jgi:ABC-2 type transport system ATP-binding protein